MPARLDFLLPEPEARPSGLAPARLALCLAADGPKATFSSSGSKSDVSKICPDLTPETKG